MLIEVDYLDKNGSVCWFCGNPLNINELAENSYSDKIAIKTYRCTCQQGHTSFIQQYTVKDEFDLYLTMHYYIYIEDYIQHSIGDVYVKIKET